MVQPLIKCRVCYRPMQSGTKGELYCSDRCRKHDTASTTILLGIVMILGLVVADRLNLVKQVIFLIGFIFIIAGLNKRDASFKFFDPSKYPYYLKRNFVNSPYHANMPLPRPIQGTIRIEGNSIEDANPSSNRAIPISQAAMVTFTQRRTVRACCYQTMRLQETYCPCGRAVESTKFN